MFLVVGQEKKLRVDDAWHWKHEAKEYEHITTILDRQGAFGQNNSDPVSYVRFPRSKRDAQHATSSPENASNAVKILILLEIAQNPSWMYQL